MLSHVQLSATIWTAACQASLSFTVSQSMLKLMSVELVVLSNCHILCLPFLLLPSILPSLRVFFNESALCIRWPKYWSFSFSISPSNEYSGLVSFKIDQLNLFAVQGTLKSFLQHHNSKASVLQHLVFFMVQLSHPSMTTGNTIALVIQTFVSRMMSLYIWLRWVFRCCAVFLHLWRGYSLVVVCGLYIAVASLVVEHGLSGVQTSTAAAHRLGSCGLMGPGVSRLQSLQQVGSAVAAHRL